MTPLLTLCENAVLSECKAALVFRHKQAGEPLFSRCGWVKNKDRAKLKKSSRAAAGCDGMWLCPCQAGKTVLIGDLLYRLFEDKFSHEGAG